MRIGVIFPPTRVSLPAAFQDAEYMLALRVEDMQQDRQHHNGNQSSANAYT